MVEIIELPSRRRAAAAQIARPAQPAAAPAGPAGQPGQPAVRLYVATPCFGCQMTAAYLASLLGLQAACAMRGVGFAVDFIGNESLVERARNILVARFLASDATHLLFIDADIGFRADCVFRLLGADKDVVTAVYSKKMFDWDKVAEKLAAGEAEPVYQMGLDFNINIANQTEPIEGGFVRVLDSATGFMMIRRPVLERMAEAYREELQCVNDVQGQQVKDYVALFACLIDEQTRRFLSEDYSFCRRYQKLGGEIWADLQSPLAHVGTNMFSGDLRQRLQAEAAAAAKAAAKGKAKVGEPAPAAGPRGRPALR
jgi:hypothetical protein